jgi:pfkB family carbohydrate kinase.
VVDTIGAGDTFQGSLLVALKEAGRIARPALEAISADELTAALAFGIPLRRHHLLAGRRQPAVEA